MKLAEFLNFGALELALFAAVAVPFLLVLYCLIDILRSDFKTPDNKWLFVILVLFVPFIGSIAYFILRRNYIKPKTPFV
jgi:hypothetical protein